MSILKAYSKVTLPSGEILKREVVEFSEDGTPISHFPLHEELPFVEWHDETYDFPEACKVLRSSE